MARATDTSVPNYSTPLGRTSMPSSLSAWDDRVRAVVSRWQGPIDEYQAWNEVNFCVPVWSGTVGEMITLTQRSSKIVKQVDPRAEFVTGSAIVRQPKTKRRLSASPSRPPRSQEEFLVQLPRGPEEAKSEVRRRRYAPVPLARRPGTVPLYDRERGG